MQRRLENLIARRKFLRNLGTVGVAALAAACSAPTSPSPSVAPPSNPTSVPATAASAPPAQAVTATAVPNIAAADWDKLVAAARPEGTLLAATYAGTGFRVVMDAFQEAFPGIKVEHSQFQSSSRDFVPRLLQEQKAGLYTWDIATMPPQEMLRQVKPIGGIDPIRPAIVRPDILDDKAWDSGFEAGFTDTDKKWGYAVVGNRSPIFWINADQVREDEIKSVKDLLDPKWKGKIVGADPRSKGSGFIPATVMRIRTGSDDIIRQLYRDQEVVLGTDYRPLTEFMVRGRYPLSIGAVDRPILAEFQEQGLGKNLKNVSLSELDYTSSSNNHLWLLAKAPHPNAAKLFINWLLTREGQIVFSKNIQANSRRLDVPTADESVLPVKGVSYLSADAEDFIPEQQKTQDLAKEALD